MTVASLTGSPPTPSPVPNPIPRGAPGDSQRIPSRVSVEHDRAAADVAEIPQVVERFIDFLKPVGFRDVRREGAALHVFDDVLEVVERAAADADNLLFANDDFLVVRFEAVVRIGGGDHAPARLDAPEQFIDSTAQPDEIVGGVAHCAVREALHLADQIVVAHIDRLFRTKFTCQLKLCPGPAGRDDRCPEMPRDLHALDTERADAVQQHGVAALDLALILDGVIHAQDSVRQNRGVLERDLVADPHQLVIRHLHVFRK